ncbi:MBL fold metallo-hydrolase [Aquibacillus halophilus]|uniref:MBL fold metallo-hydrolase n=1 Tax=Aquibacillus halophilus TaxID=930132 RepID=A0A6A8DBR4_9BACI|nr:MBL fold metallo-hydrolase [Aquibacillus halophilus]MRH43133.1 MBL fold metallo-hydrolase [Aquibacillus halophilus]
MNIKKMSLGPLGTNCYIVSETNSAIIFDPGGEPEKIITYLEGENLNPKAILLTHAHFDHIGAVDHVRDYYNIPVYVHELEDKWLGNPNLNGSALFPLGEIKSREPDFTLEIGEMVINDFHFEVKHTPGHSPGGVIFIFDKQGFVIAGDSLFKLGIGRTDLPGGNHEQLLNSIRECIFTLDDALIVYPGHGEDTTIKTERSQNPFLNI